MGAVATLHRLLSTVLVFGALGGVMWTITRIGPADPGARLLLWTRVTAWAVAADAALGVLLALGGRSPADRMHLIVGPATLLALPLGLLVARWAPGRARTWCLLAGWLALLGLCLRAVGTGAAVQ